MSISQQYYISVEIRYRNNVLGKWIVKWCGNHARGIFYGVISQGVAPYFLLMENNLICSFFGDPDTDITDEIYHKAAKEIVNAVNFGCRTFYFGSYDAFELLCHGIVTDIMKKYPELNIRRVYLTTYRDLSEGMLPNFKDRHPLDVEICILQPYRTHKMIADSRYFVFFTEEYKECLASDIYRYAKTKRGKTAVNVYEK